MPDLADHDVVLSAFDEFREIARTEIRPPGATTAHRTLTRRRRSRRIGIAVLALGLVGVSVTAVKLPGTGETRPATVADQLSDADLAQLTELSATMMGFDADHPRLGTSAGPLKKPDEQNHQLGTADRPLPAGVYTVEALCFGRGTTDVRWTTAVTPDTGSTTIVCSAPPPCSATTCVNRGEYPPKGLAKIQLTSPGSINLSFFPDQQAIGHSAAAVRVTDPREVAAVSALGPYGSDHIFGGSGAFEDANRFDKNAVPTGPGHYRATAICVGAGSLRLTFAMDADTVSATVPCTDHPAPVSVDLTTDGTRQETSVQLEADDNAKNTSGFAYWVSRV